MNSLALPKTALNHINQIILHHNELDEVFFEAGLTLQEELENFKEVKRAILKDYENFEKTIRALQAKSSFTKEDTVCAEI